MLILQCNILYCAVKGNFAMNIKNYSFIKVIAIIFSFCISYDVQANPKSEANIKSAVTKVLVDYKVSELDVYEDDEDVYAVVINVSTESRDIKATGINVLHKILSANITEKLGSVDISVLGTKESLNVYYNGEDCSILGKGKREDIPCTNSGALVPDYKIEKKSCFAPHKCSYDLRINNKLTESELSAIANKLYAESPSVDRIFITYYLPCMKPGSGAWANATFDPNLKVTIMDWMLISNPTCRK